MIALGSWRRAAKADKRRDRRHPQRHHPEFWKNVQRGAVKQRARAGQIVEGPRKKTPKRAVDIVEELIAQKVSGIGWH